MPSLEEALFEALEEERKLSEERALLPGLLQHDLANVLCQVSLSVAVFPSVAEGVARERCLRDIQGGVKRMSELLSGMRFLFLTRSGAADYGPGDLVAFINELVHEPGVWPTGAAITLDLPPALNCSFSPTLIRHALVNLIGNAVAYSRGTWVRVRLALVLGERWQLTVANGGPGIPADHLPYLFELGHAVKYSGKIGSPGLGLYIARMCVRFHGSVLRVRTSDVFTVFSFNVRVARSQHAAGEVVTGNFYAA
jgi:two-component system sensor histidine kinase QseC